MPCANTARSSRRRERIGASGNYGRICSAPWPATRFRCVPDAPSRALLNAAPNLFPYSIVHAENSSNSLIATAAGTADHANFKALTNRHSGLTPSWSDPFLISHYGLSRALKRVKNHYGDTDDRQYGCCNLVGDSPTLQISISIFLVVINISRQKHNTNA